MKFHLKYVNLLYAKAKKNDETCSKVFRNGDKTHLIFFGSSFVWFLRQFTSNSFFNDDYFIYFGTGFRHSTLSFTTH